MKKLLYLLLLIGAFNSIKSQDSISKEVTNFTIVNLMERSYLMPQVFSSNRLNGENVELNPVLFEAKVSPSFQGRINKKIGIVANIDILMRMLRIKGLPVRTPQYTPSLTLFYDFSDYETSWIWLLTSKLAHYSNGQEDEYFENKTTKKVNLKSGNFSTDFFQLGVTWAQNNSNSLGTGTFYIQQHFNVFDDRETDMDDNFYYTRLYCENSFFYKKRIDWYWKVGGACNFSSVSNIYGTTGSIQAEVGIKPFKKSDFYFSVKYYYGRDYYNIFHIYNRNALTLGIVTDVLSLDLFQ